MKTFCEDCNAELKTEIEIEDGVCDACHEKEKETISDVLFSSPCKESGFCRNADCDTAVAQFSETGNWYITFGHAGFNSPANNTNGYATKNKALAAMRRYLSK